MTALFQLWKPRTKLNFKGSSGYYLDIWVPLYNHSAPQTLHLYAIEELPGLYPESAIDWNNTEQQRRIFDVQDLSQLEGWTDAEVLRFDRFKELIKEESSSTHQTVLKVAFCQEGIEDVIRSNQTRDLRHLVNYSGNLDRTILINCFKVPEITNNNLKWSKFRLRPNIGYKEVEYLRFGLLDLDMAIPGALRPIVPSEFELNPLWG